jgi:hypothetical protein
VEVVVYTLAEAVEQVVIKQQQDMQLLLVLP